MNPLNSQANQPQMPPSASGGVPTGAFDPWTFRDDAGVTGADLVGYDVTATDGDIGKIDAASSEVNASFLVVDTGRWIFGKKVMLPAGVVNRVDHEARTVAVDRTKDQIKAAPEFDDDAHTDPAYRADARRLLRRHLRERRRAAARPDRLTARVSGRSSGSAAGRTPPSTTVHKEHLPPAGNTGWRWDVQPARHRVGPCGEGVAALRGRHDWPLMATAGRTPSGSNADDRSHDHRWPRCRPAAWSDRATCAGPGMRQRRRPAQHATAAGAGQGPSIADASAPASPRFLRRLTPGLHVVLLRGSHARRAHREFPRRVRAGPTGCPPRTPVMPLRCSRPGSTAGRGAASRLLRRHVSSLGYGRDAARRHARLQLPRPRRYRPADGRTVRVAPALPLGLPAPLRRGRPRGVRRAGRSVRSSTCAAPAEVDRDGRVPVYDGCAYHHIHPEHEEWGRYDRAEAARPLPRRPVR